LIKVREIFPDVPTFKARFFPHWKFSRRASPGGRRFASTRKIPPGTNSSSPEGVAIHAMRYNDEVCNAWLLISSEFLIRLASTLSIVWLTIVGHALDGGYRFPFGLYIRRHSLGSIALLSIQPLGECYARIGCSTPSLLWANHQGLPHDHQARGRPPHRRRQS
jgi:hypothetical protein